MNNKEAKEYYKTILAACRDEALSLRAAYRMLRGLLEQLCRTQMSDSSLQITDLSARITFVAGRVDLSPVEQNRLHTFRLTSNDVLNHRTEPQRELLLRDAKTLAFFVRKLTGEDIPHELYRLLPRTDATYLVAPPAKDRMKQMRVCFDYADEQYLYVTPVDAVSEESLRVRYNVPGVNDEFAGTCEALWHHARLNLLDVAVDEACVLTPAFFILEPDYLIDISSLAECFKEYGHHPLNYVYARLQPSDNTRALLLGNIANLFLDEWIHAPTDVPPDYLACMKKAFRQYALELAACPDLLDPEKERQFFADCRLHFDNIRQTVQETFPASGYELRKEDAVLEPSYICKALGLQGRLDYMQRDMLSFIEMKSGKADEYAIRGRIEPKENNKVQMLLYQAVLEYSMGMNHRSVHAYLFYTRYPLLYPARPSWALVRRAMDVRNRIVAAEYGIQLRNSPHYTARQLAALTPETLNERNLSNVLWKRYQAPVIQALADRRLALTTLEQSYFYTLYNFITKELYTSKSGDVEYEGRTGASALWQTTLEEKLEAGEILIDFRIRENHAPEVHKPNLVLAMPDSLYPDFDTLSSASSQPNFRLGDAVLLYERCRPEDNATNRMVFKGNIEYITDSEVCIRLRASQQNQAVLPPNSLYAVEHDGTMESSFRSMYQGLSAFLDATQRRRDLLLGQLRPEFDETLCKAIETADDDFRRITLKAQAARDYFLLVGPPGTGKTSRALRSMVEAFHAEGRQILLLSYTNRAVDEICKTLSAIRSTVDYIRLGSELNCEETYRPHLIENILVECSNRRSVQQRLETCHIFVGTVATLSAKADLFRLKSFDVAIVDEATQILEPQLLGLLCRRSPSGGDAIGKFILIGDHKQLPAVVLQSAEQSEVCSEDLRAIGLYNLKDSLFERLYRRLQEEVKDNPRLSVSYDMLCRQGRMNPGVALFSNRAFYEGKLQPVGLPHQSGDIALATEMIGTSFADILTRRIAFLPSQPEAASAASYKQNRSEARMVASLSEAIYRQYTATEGFDPQYTLGIITPYRSQIALIKSELQHTDIPALMQLTVDTVERYQGSERDVIIYSFCVNRLQQLRFLACTTEERGVVIDRKLNVALTRARKQLFLTGVPELLQENEIYRKLLSECPHFAFVQK